MLRKSLLLMALCAGMALPQANAAEVTYNPTAGSTDNCLWGTKRTENYDVAIKIDSPELVGSTIKGVRIPFNSSENIDSCSIFLTTSLNLQTINKVKCNNADVVCVTVTPVNGELAVDFDEPYTITDDGVYVGYSFRVNSVTDDTTAQYPVTGVAHAVENGLYVHATRSYLKWMDKSESLGFAASINAIIDGGFSDNSAGIKSIVAPSGKSGAPVTVNVTVANYGLKEISSLDFGYSIDGAEPGSVHVDLDSPISNYYGTTKIISVELPAFELKGSHDLSLTIDKVNGSDNASGSKASKTTLTYYSFVPVHRSVEEEYTGTWCGWCPRGFAALEHMSTTYPEFIGIAYHNSDEMEIMSSSSYPNKVSGFPTAWFDRQDSGDPFYGVYEKGTFPVEDEWLARCAEFTPASVDVMAGFESADSNIIKANATVTFATDLDDINYKLAYVLVHDDMYDDSWVQSNYYTSYSHDSVLSETGIEELADFCSGGKYGSSYVSGLHFNDVVIYADDIKGINGSIPSSVSDLQTVNHEYSFDITLANNTSGQNLIQNREKLRVVALLLDADTGYIVNAARTDVATESGVTPVIVNGEVVGSEYYDMQGRRILSPSNGIYINRVTYSNGAVTTSKVVVR